MQPIGYLKSPFKFKNGTPRQATVCGHARGSLTIEKSVFNNPEHSLDGLENFSHVWLLFVFHKNNNGYTKAKVKPPRLNGKRVGLFSTRSPYRPNNIGLTLARIDSVNGSTVFVSSIDILDGTPILDIKPYIPQYDNPVNWTVESSALDEQATNDQENLPANHVPILQDEQMENASDDSENLDDFQSIHSKENASMASEMQDEFLHGMKEIDDKIALSGSQSDLAVVTEHLEDASAHHQVENIGKPLVNSGSDLKEDAALFSSEHTNIHSGKKDGALFSSELPNIHGTNDDIAPKSHLEEGSNEENKDDETSARVHMKCDQILNVCQEITDSQKTCSNMLSAANWITNPPIDTLNVRFTQTADNQLKRFHYNSEVHASLSDTKKDICNSHQFQPPHSTVDNSYRLQYLKSVTEARNAITNILQEDPRSTYRRKHCVDSLYYFTLDVIHVTCWFDNDTRSVEIVRVKPAALVEQCKSQYMATAETL